VESGLSYAVPKVVAQIAALGISPEEIRYLVITHAHFDHYCALPALKKAFPHLRTVASPVAARVLAKEKVVAGHFIEDRYVAESMLRKGLLADYDASFQPPSTIGVDMVVHEGDALDLGGGCTLSFCATPGHSPCSISTYLPLGEVLFPSDCLGFAFEDMDIFPGYFSSYADYIQSIQKVSGIEASVLAFHQSAAVTDKRKTKAFVHHSLKMTEKVHDFIIRAEKDGQSHEAISQRLFDGFYRDEVTIQSERNIRLCTDLLVRRSLTSS
jgi:glyoxylase-like metal-dependent hydrolase (beta-lactamase superfamily II)